MGQSQVVRPWLTAAGGCTIDEQSWGFVQTMQEVASCADPTVLAACS
jgi:hypothetical protein